MLRHLTVLLATLALAACETTAADFDGDGVPDSADCEPDNPLVYPGAEDPWGDGEDTDCSTCPYVGRVDGIDRDCDGYPGNVERGADNYDCDDNNDTVHPEADDPEDDGIDQNCDEVAPPIPCVDEDGDSYCLGVDDCDDADPEIHVFSTEVTNCVDDDCDGEVDEDLPTSDGDGDLFCVGADLGFGLQCCDSFVEPGDCDDAEIGTNLHDFDGDGVDTCGADRLPGTGDEDCDDFDDDRSPVLEEVCDGVDNDCDTVVPDDEDDDDGDGLSDCEGDCNDADGEIHPFDLDLDGGSPCEGDCDDTDPDLRMSDLDGDTWSPCDGDCDDADPSIHPTATEQCNGVDDDCDGVVPDDEDDDDGDTLTDCEGDCDDSDAAMHPFDLDLDGSSPCEGDCDDTDVALRPTDLDADGASPCDGDCDDFDPAIYPAATELCNGIDDNCDGVLHAEWVDVDLDGVMACDDCDDNDAANAGPDLDNDGYFACGTDCDDYNGAINPGATDLVGDGLDQNCDGRDGIDFDGDTYASILSGGDDCDDQLNWVHPGAAESCDGVDANCDGVVDTDIGLVWYPDGDGDNFGAVGTTVTQCDQPVGYAADTTDCDDSDPDVFPGAPEVCDNIDSNCDGDADTDLALVWYPDADGDSYGAVGTTVSQCDQPIGYAADTTDCDDGDPTIYPGAPELCDGIDQDCDSDLSTEIDGDGDGEAPCEGDCADTDPAIHTHAVEVPYDGVDQNCDGIDACHDLNCDGWPDLVVGNQFNGASPLIDSYIYYGGPAGFSATNRAGIPTKGAGEVRIADLDGDGFQDIVIGNHDDISRTYPFDFSWIYWGSASGHSASDRTSLPTFGAAGIEVADVNNDDLLDIVVSNFAVNGFPIDRDIDSFIYLGDGGGRFTTISRIDLPTLGAWGNAVVDLDNDGYLDVAFANYSANSGISSQSYIYWGSPAGFDPGNPTEIECYGPYAIKPGDLDGNGLVDLVLASYGNQTFWSTQSKIWSHFPALDGGWSSVDLPTFGASGASVGDLDMDGDLDVFIAHQQDGNSVELDSYVYWNDGNGQFNPLDALALPTNQPVTSFIGDLNLDGYNDLVVSSSVNDIPNPNIDSLIYWGSQSGLDPSNVSGVPSHGGTGVRAAGGNIPLLRSIWTPGPC